ncbi:rRNA methyltransferase [Mycolicibacterium canariasense]|uniref:rRNA methyltransferase n=1 Tax=Mycolicibacterium canariasense TaxID=228230 RepID=UPI000A14A70B|nr:rRNA methyltransferase [Mycolicibacterium canariasense]MCV7208352.1 rRNA methyltransferase [Mycolicibacterium canariasense]ORV13540.1 rRNA methyltransferase [Mycolicibacterium canariasense]
MSVAPVVNTYTDHEIWSDIKEINSSDENVKKFVFTTGDAVAESVLYKYPTYEDRTVICCSTQSGCPVGCRFCGAGDNFVRNLTTDEIVSQPAHLMDSQGIDAGRVERMQIMFMSMGEPLLNPTHLFPAIRQLHDLYPRAALLISTSAPRVNYAPLRLISQEVPTVGLQFSVHESTDAARNLLVPFKAKLSLAEIAHEGELWFEATGRQPFFNYCVHERNNTAEDVARLVSLFTPGIWQATISVICERDESIAAANERQRQLASDFMTMMLESGYSTRMFDPAGQDDIGGGCGQLWYVQDWMARHPELARPSVGHGLDVVHTPSLR